MKSLLLICFPILWESDWPVHHMCNWKKFSWVLRLCKITNSYVCDIKTPIFPPYCSSVTFLSHFLSWWLYDKKSMYGHDTSSGTSWDVRAKSFEAILLKQMFPKEAFTVQITLFVKSGQKCVCDKLFTQFIFIGLP